MQGRRMTSLWAAMLGAWLSAGPAGTVQPQGVPAQLDAQATSPSQAEPEADTPPLPERRRRIAPAACST